MTTAMTPDPKLDDRVFLAKADPSGMQALVEQFPGQFSTRFDVSAEMSRWFAGTGTGDSHQVSRRRLWIAAMGGSAFAGDMIAVALQKTGIDATVVRSYRLPDAAAPGDRFLALSYSGKTAETLAAFEKAGSHGLLRAAITSGGELAERCHAEKVPWVKLPENYPPRAAAGLAWTAGIQAALLAGLSVTPPDSVARSLASCPGEWGADAPAAHNAAKLVASRFHGRLPILYAGAGAPEAALLRWRTQLNENAKILCHTAAIPEMNHNEIVGWTDSLSWKDRASVLFLKDCGEDEITSRRIELTHEWLSKRGVSTMEIQAAGESPVERLWWVCHLSDYVSVYLAALRGVDPTPVKAIDELKQRLAEEHL